MSGRVFKALALLVGASLLLTACDPPMPPEVKAALAEQTFTCELGDTQLSAPPAIAAVAGDWQSSVATNCEGMSITPVDIASDSVELQIGETKSCQAFAKVPFAVDAAVLAFSLADVTNLNLSAEAVEGIWSGKIQSWNDPLLISLNPSFELPATPISFGIDADPEHLNPLNQWLTRLANREVSLSGGSLTLDTLAEGGVVATTYSAAMELGLTLVGISEGEGTEGVVPEVGSLNSGASMFQTEAVSGGIATTFNPKAKPIAPEGVDVAPAPYQAVSIINLSLCGTDSLKTRAAARYILRQDSQGSLGLSTVVGLPENLRIVALDLVSKGLPEPIITGVPAK